MFKSGILLQWKCSKQNCWGWYYEKPPLLKDINNNFLRKKIFEEDLYNEYLLQLRDLENRKNIELSKVKDDSHESDEKIKIFSKYHTEYDTIENRFNLFNYQYALLTIDNLTHEYKIGNVILKKITYWQCIVTKRNGDILNIWVKENDVEPFIEKSYDIKNVLLAKHLGRKNKNK